MGFVFVPNIIFFLLVLSKKWVHYIIGIFVDVHIVVKMQPYDYQSFVKEKKNISYNITF